MEEIQQAKKDMKTYEKLLKLLDGTDANQSEAFLEYGKDLFTVTSVAKGCAGFHWNEDTCLWTEFQCVDGLLKKVSKFMVSLYDKVIKPLKRELNAKEEEGRNTEYVESQIKYYSKLQKNMCNVTHLEKLIRMMKTDLFDDTFRGKLDVSKHLLPIKNKRVINLKTKEIRQRTKDDYFTYELDLDYTTEQPNAKRFYSQLMKEDVEKTKYLQLCTGYSITGETDQKCFFVMLGSGNNGKSAYMNLSLSLFSSFYTNVTKNVIFNMNDNNNLLHVAKLAGKRIGALNEPSDTMHFDEASVKALTGNGDSVTGKFLFQNTFDFVPIIKIFVLTNKVVYLDASSQAMINRFHLINMNAVFSENPDYSKGEYKIDSDFITRLKTEYKNEVFSWIVDGAFMYYQEKKITKPESIIKDQNIYVNNIDSIQSFIDLKCTVDIKKRNNRKVLYDQFINHCKECGDTFVGVTPQKFYDCLQKKGFGVMKSNGYMFITGLQLNTMDDDSDDDYENNSNVFNNSIFKNIEQPIKEEPIVIEIKEEPKKVIDNVVIQKAEEPIIIISKKEYNKMIKQHKSLVNGSIEIQKMKDKIRIIDEDLESTSMNTESDESYDDETDSSKISKYISGVLDLSF